MHREFHRWHSPSLGRSMDLLIFGHGGARVIVFPTSKGRFYEWEDRGMAASLSHQINNGWLQLYCVDSVDEESWYNWGAHPGARAYRHHQYMDYVRNEVVPLSEHRNGMPYLMTMGASFGVFHAMSFAARYPDKVDRVLAFSGMFDIRGFTGGYSDPYVYQYNPMECIAQEWDGHRLGLLRRMDIILASGRDDRLIHSARAMSAVLWNKGIGNALREWDGWSHDWPYWTKMMHMYINGHD